MKIKTLFHKRDFSVTVALLDVKKVLEKKRRYEQNLL